MREADGKAQRRPRHRTHEPPMCRRATHAHPRECTVFRWIRLTLAGFGLLLLAAGLALPVLAPPVAAAACPACYGLKRAGTSLMVDRAMTATDRARLARDLSTAGDKVRVFYGPFEPAALVIACASQACNQRLGGRGALARTWATPFGDIIDLAPKGLNATILAHEFSHVALHQHAGLPAMLGETIPAWFDEGLAVIVSDDPRYLKPGAQGHERCVVSPAWPLPSSAGDWGARAGRDRMIYAQAACAVLAWMEANGGRAGALAAIDAAAGTPADAMRPAKSARLPRPGETFLWPVRGNPL
ncbi:hypothetical protein [Xanthobacter agilis]|uniref:DUF4157 domain-containing protein n=1 Tax=Xanthobacter agilis TaxID=47492 RepID=A0ABU0L970_XANAG|nr:hypothetical protein [Xanthobacter agilis]MDQ0503683.1 hypothetical protein [Xanthobacter agilis]